MLSRVIPSCAGTGKVMICMLTFWSRSTDRKQEGEAGSERCRTHPPEPVDDTTLVLLDYAQAHGRSNDRQRTKYCQKP